MSRGIFIPGKRLAAAAELVAAPLYSGETQQLHAIDVGTDHAYLAVYLIQMRYCAHVTATDLREGPVHRAKENVSRRTLKGEHLQTYIDVLQADGLAGLSHLDFQRVVICGMGGEVIASILERAPFLQDTNRKIKLILQPQSSEAELRDYLYAAGFYFLDEKLVEDKGRIYTIMAVSYDGHIRRPSPEVLLLGEKIIEQKGPLYETLLHRRLDSVTKRIAAKRAAGLDISDDETLLLKLNDLQKGT